MFGFGRLGAPELILILLIALLIFGPRKLPEIGRAIGKAIKEFRTGTARSGTDSPNDAGPPEDTADSEAVRSDSEAVRSDSARPGETDPADDSRDA